MSLGVFRVVWLENRLSKEVLPSPLHLPVLFLLLPSLLKDESTLAAQ